MDQSQMQAMLDADERHWWYRGRRRVIRAELDALGLGGELEILDAGCGSGRTMVELADYGHVSGLELNPQAAEVARERAVGEVREGRLEQLPWPDHSFDLITCLDVVEHTPDDRATFAELLRVCRPGGHLLVTVPAYPLLWSAHDVANHHFRRYTRPALRAAAGDGGWEVRRVSSFNSVLLAPAAAVRLADRVRSRSGGAGGSNGSGGSSSPSGDSNGSTDLDLGPAWLNSALEWPMAVEARWLSSGRTLGAGLSLLAVLVAPEVRTR